MNLEEYILKNHYKIKSDDTYISDGVFAVVKDKIRNNFISNFKNNSNNILQYVSIAAGKDFEIKFGTEAVLLKDKKIGIKYKNDIYFDYEIIKMFFEYFRFECLYTTIVEKGFKSQLIEDDKLYPILKFFDDEDNFIGCLTPIVQ